MLLTCALAFSLAVAAAAADGQAAATQSAIESQPVVELSIDAVAPEQTQPGTLAEPIAEPPQSQAPGDQSADAQKPPTPEHTGLHALFYNLIEDIKHLPARQNLYLAAVGGGLAAAVHPVDQTFNIRLLSHYDAVNTAFAPGKYIGDTPEQVAASLGAYLFGRLAAQPKVAHLGMDLVQAQILTEMLIEPIKFGTQRLRPDNSNRQSFPSGHAAITFATATVIERHLGWKKSVLGYAVASYVAASRLHDNRHYLSDVVFGAAVGSIAGRTVVHHAADYWALAPVYVPGGGAIFVTLRVAD
jgi:membrane-associated phospholipid phosphatase